MVLQEILNRVKQAVCLLCDILQIDSVLKLNGLGRLRIALSRGRRRLPRRRFRQLGAQLFDLFLFQIGRFGSLLKILMRVILIVTKVP